jgi:hypothetical protein
MVPDAGLENRVNICSEIRIIPPYIPPFLFGRCRSFGRDNATSRAQCLTLPLRVDAAAVIPRDAHKTATFGMSGSWCLAELGRGHGEV